MATRVLTQMDRYAAGALFALALRQAQIHQTQPLGWVDAEGGDDEVPDRHSSSSSGSGSGSSEGGDGDAEQLWTHKRRRLLRPVFRFLEIEPKSWPGLEETAASSSVKHHIGAFLRMLFEESDESPEMLDQQLALRKAVDAMAMSLEASISSDLETREEQCKYEHECREKFSASKASAEGEVSNHSEGIQIQNNHNLSRERDNLVQVEGSCEKKTDIIDMPQNVQRSTAVLYEILVACITDLQEDGEDLSMQRKGYDARHRVALRLLATWLDIKWIKMEAMEIMVACSAIAAAKEADAQTEDTSPHKGKWSKWKRGGIIGAAALTGGTLLAITGGLAAPAIAAGFSALAPTLGTLVPVIGASGFAAAASAAGSVAGSVAVAASFGAAGAGLSGSKMARRIGSVEEFEFIPFGENHNQGRLSVAIFVSGFIFEKEDFVKPWELKSDGSERYAIQWETKNLVAVSNAIQDWLTSRLTMELMKQGAMLTVLSTLVAALAWPATLLSATDFIDGKWTIAIDRSDKAGELLADVLLKGLQGNRPVTLVGFSLGARVIFKCLQYLAETGSNEGIVEKVVLLGAPISLKDEPWESARRMVAGRFVNVYSANDWILGVTFRASLLTKGLAGIQPVDIDGVENVDVTEFIDGHSSYLWTAHKILEQLELDMYYPVFSCFPK